MLSFGHLIIHIDQCKGELKGHKIVQKTVCRWLLEENTSITFHMTFNSDEFALWLCIPQITKIKESNLKFYGENVLMKMEFYTLFSTIKGY